MDSRLTTDPASGVRAAGFNAHLYDPDAKPVYYTIDHVRHMARLNSTPATVPVADVRDAITAEALFKQRTFGHATEMYAGVCSECGSPFQSTSPRTMTCQNIACKQQRDELVQNERRERERAAKLTTVTCSNPGCGNQFTTHDQRVKTCSAECARARRHQKRREARVAA